MKTDKALNTDAHTGYHCPACGSEKIWRIQRSVPEKIVYNLSERKYAAKKFQCSACGYSFLIDSDGKQPRKHSGTLDAAERNLINCPRCHHKMLRISKVAFEERKLNQENDKTPFRKLLCDHCAYEIVIYKEDYDQADENEI